MEEVKNEGPKEMTLDEWKAMQDKERTKVEFNIRKPNEGNDSQWKKGYVLHKSKSEDVSMERSSVAREDFGGGTTHTRTHTHASCLPMHMAGL